MEVFLEEILKNPSASSIIQTSEVDRLWSRMGSDDPLHAVAALKGADLFSDKNLPPVIRNELEKSQGLLLDAGSGYGRLGIPLAIALPKLKIIGLDGSRFMLDLYAKEKKKFPKIEKNIELVQSELQNLPFKDESFDVLLSSAVLLHNSHKNVEKILIEFHRVLKKGGKLILVGSFPNLYSLQGLVLKIYSSIQGEKNGPVRPFSKSYLKKQLSSFQQVSFESNRLVLLPPELSNLIPSPKLKKFIKWTNQLFTNVALPLFKKSGFFVSHHDILAIK